MAWSVLGMHARAGGEAGHPQGHGGVHRQWAAGAGAGGPAGTVRGCGQLGCDLGGAPAVGGWERRGPRHAAMYMLHAHTLPQTSAPPPQAERERGGVVGAAGQGPGPRGRHPGGPGAGQPGGQGPARCRARGARARCACPSAPFCPSAPLPLSACISCTIVLPAPCCACAFFFWLKMVGADMRKGHGKEGG